MSEGVWIALIALIGVTLGPVLLAVTNDVLKARRERLRLKAEKENREREALATVEALQETVTSQKVAYEAMTADRDFWRGRAEHLERMCFGGVRAT